MRFLFLLIIFSFSCSNRKIIQNIQISSITAALIAKGSMSQHACAKLDNLSISCWGRGDKGQIGDGFDTNQTTPTSAITLPGSQQALQLAVGEFHTCALLDNLSISCWGEGQNGRLGYGGIANQSTPIDNITLPGNRLAVKIATGEQHTCAILDNSSVSCWGKNGDGELGDGSTDNSLSPVDNLTLPNGRLAIDISLGQLFSCALLDNSSVSCWGKGTNGRLGIGSNDDQLLPVTSLLPTGRTARKISTGQRHVCVILDNFTVSCWGNNTFGQLGTGTVPGNIDTPLDNITMPDNRLAIAISTGEDITCAILDNLSVSCWGKNNSGQLGLGTTSAYENIPSVTLLPSGRKALDIKCGSAHCCCLLDNYQVSCWGDNSNGVVGDGSGETQSTPVIISF